MPALATHVTSRGFQAYTRTQCSPCPRRRNSASNNRAIANSQTANATLNAKIDSWIAVTARKKSSAPAGYGLGTSGLFSVRVSGVCNALTAGSLGTTI